MFKIPEQGAESPEYLRMSLAAAMTLGFKQGLFFRNAKLYCVNLLLTYRSGCTARCAYCGLSRKRQGSFEKKSFIRVTWPTYALTDIIQRIALHHKRVRRICISMVTNARAVADTKAICSRLRSDFDIPVSLLVSPTIITPADLNDFKTAGADKIGVAVDLATEDLFERYRGGGVNGPHSWETYQQCLADSVRIFGRGNAGVHLIVGMGESEKEMAQAIQANRDMGCRSHLFSFYPESGSALSERSLPPMAQYRHLQMARYLIDEKISREERFSYNVVDKIVDFGITATQIQALITAGEAFRTSGCSGSDGRVACNRPFANSRPGPDMRNYPFSPATTDIERIKGQLFSATRYRAVL